MRFARRVLALAVVLAAFAGVAGAVFVRHWLGTPLAIGSEPVTV